MPRDKPGGLRLSLVVIGLFLATLLWPLIFGIPVPYVPQAIFTEYLILGPAGLYLFLQRRSTGAYLQSQILVVCTFVLAAVLDGGLQLHIGSLVSIALMAAAFISSVALGVNSHTLFTRAGGALATMVGSLVAFYFVYIPGVLFGGGLYSDAGEAVRGSRELLVNYVVSGMLILEATMYMHLFLAALFSVLGCGLCWLANRGKAKNLRQMQ